VTPAEQSENAVRNLVGVQRQTGQVSVAAMALCEVKAPSITSASIDQGRVEEHPSLRQ